MCTKCLPKQRTTYLIVLIVKWTHFQKYSKFMFYEVNCVNDVIISVGHKTCNISAAIEWSQAITIQVPHYWNTFVHH